MAQEIRIRAEGTFYWVAQSMTASTSGAGYYTGSLTAPPLTGANTVNILGYVQDGLTVNPGYVVETIYDRGTASHFKKVRTDAPTVAVKQLYGVTGNFPPTATGAGASATMPLYYLEWKMTAPEQAASVYYRFYNATPLAPKITEAEKGNSQDFSFVCTNIAGPTASGYLG